MQATLKFELPEESQEFKDACNGTTYKLALDEIYSECFRGPLKYEELSEEVYTKLESLREKFFEIIQQNNIELN